MRKFGMEAITDDNTVFRVVKDVKGVKRELIVAIVVDDCMMTGDSEELRLEWVEFMRGFFELTYDGDLQWYLGVKYEKSETGIKASQRAYLDRCLKRFRLEECNTAATPMDARFAVTPDDIDEHPDPAVRRQLRCPRSRAIGNGANIFAGDSTSCGIAVLTGPSS